MDELFRKLTLRPKLWSFQKEVANHLLEGKNVILSAPTGAGKTWAALMSYLYSKHKGQPHVDRVFYTLPLRTLATSLYRSTRIDCQNVFTQVDDLWQDRAGKELAITIQTGEQQDDPFFLGDICFTTIDQLLSGYLNIPFSLPEKLANINAGALLGALVVIDEIHLLEADKSLWTVLEMAKRLRPYTQFLFMTATLSSAAIELIRECLDAKVVSVQPEELIQMPSHSNKQRTYHWIEQPVTAGQIIERHEGGRSIVICNTVTKAQEIYQDLNKLATNDCKVILLHSRFYQGDRVQKEGQLGDYFGPNAIKKNVILVATQVVEAGIDISAENLHTQLCPANSLLQRAGRCARYPSRNVGNVWVYELEQSKSGRFKLGPYRERKVALTVGLTREAMIKRNGEMLDFQAEQQLVDEVHEKIEQQVIADLLANMTVCREKVNLTIDKGGTDKARDLIRDIHSVNILFSDNPETVDLEKAPQLLSLPRTSLYVLEKLLPVNHSGKWLAKIPVYNADRFGGSPYEWEELTKPDDLAKITWLVAISPEVAAYSEEIGFQLGVKGEVKELKYKTKPPVPSYSYEFEPYEEHVCRVVLKNRDMAPYFSRASLLLEDTLKLPKGLVNWLTEVTCAFHDVGKLSETWFGASWAWQMDNYPDKVRRPEGRPLAHCTYRPENRDWQRQKSSKLYNRGSHALEGAFAILNSLLECILTKGIGEEQAELLTCLVVTAISRHHSGRAENIGNFTMKDQAVQWVNQSLDYCQIDCHISGLNNCMGETQQSEFKNYLIQVRNEEMWIPLYWLLIRRLRLADQGSLKEGG